MKCRNLCAIVLLVFFGIVSFANATDEPQWFGSGGGTVDPGISAIHDRNWFDPNNWRYELDPSGLPTAAAMVKVNQVWNNDGPVIWGPVTITQLKVSEVSAGTDPTASGPQNTSVTTGGNLTTSGEIFLGWNGPVLTRTGTLPGNEGTFIQAGGLTSVGGNMNVGGIPRRAYLCITSPVGHSVTGRLNLGHYGRVQNRSVNFPLSYVVLS